MGYYIAKSIKKDKFTRDIVMMARCNNESPSVYEPITLKGTPTETPTLQLARLVYYGDVQLLKSATHYGIGQRIREAIISSCGDWHARAWADDDTAKEHEELDNIKRYLLIH